jgi:sugar/nucleoside kinase (ribokinase family)
LAEPVLVVGSTGLDTIETQGQTVKDVIGGSSVYFAAAASIFAPVRLVSVVGEDFPAEGRAALERHNVDLAGLEVVEGGKTFRWGGRYSADMNSRETLFTELNVLGDFKPKLPPEYRATPYVFLANGPTATQHAVLDELEGEAYIAADTMNLWINTERDELMRLLSRIDLLILNDEEARMISGSDALWDAARDITKLGPRAVVLKKGEHGSYLVHEGGRAAVPAYPIEKLVDPTGAGDSFAGAFMGAVARAGSTDAGILRSALAVASVVASFACESFGPERLLSMDSAEVDSRLDELRELVRF